MHDHVKVNYKLQRILRVAMYPRVDVYHLDILCRGRKKASQTSGACLLHAASSRAETPRLLTFVSASKGALSNPCRMQCNASIGRRCMECMLLVWRKVLFRFFLTKTVADICGYG